MHPRIARNGKQSLVSHLEGKFMLLKAIMASKKTKALLDLVIENKIKEMGPDRKTK